MHRYFVDNHVAASGAVKVAGANGQITPLYFLRSTQDQLLANWLRFIESQVAERPEDVAPADLEQLRRIRRLVEDVG